MDDQTLPGEPSGRDDNTAQDSGTRALLPRGFVDAWIEKLREARDGLKGVYLPTEVGAALDGEYELSPDEAAALRRPLETLQIVIDGLKAARELKVQDGQTVRRPKRTLLEVDDDDDGDEAGPTKTRPAGKRRKGNEKKTVTTKTKPTAAPKKKAAAAPRKKTPATKKATTTKGSPVKPPTKKAAPKKATASKATGPKTPPKKPTVKTAPAKKPVTPTAGTRKSTRLAEATEKAS